MFLKVVDVIVNQEKVDESIVIDHEDNTNRESLSDTKQPEHDVLHGDEVQRSSV